MIRYGEPLKTTSELTHDVEFLYDQQLYQMNARIDKNTNEISIIKDDIKDIKAILDEMHWIIYYNRVLIVYLMQFFKI